MSRKINRQASGKARGTLTGRQQEVYDLIVDRLETAGRPPTMRELGSALGITSTNGVRYFLDALETKGYIERDPGLSRGIRLGGKAHRNARRRPSSTHDLPILGRIAAGTPILAEENIEDTVSVDVSLFPRREGTFALRVKGDSMTGAGILDGDLVVIRSGTCHSNGDIVAAYWEGEATVKRIFQRGENIVLRSENPVFSDIRIHPHQEDFRVLGSVVGVIRRLR